MYIYIYDINNWNCVRFFRSLRGSDISNSNLFFKKAGELGTGNYEVQLPNGVIMTCISSEVKERNATQEVVEKNFFLLAGPLKSLYV